ncbi:MAG: hypothetical protein KKC54_06010 [Nanoarchaeota archaeon]|nr:hypothetical protein [Nanoarchaeota archaeon]
MEFDGVDDYVDLVSNLDSLSNDTYSISFWMKPKKVATSIAVYGAAVVSSGERVMCGLEGSEFRCFDDYGYDVRGGTATANTWYHFTFTYNYPNQNASLYVDGSLIANDTTFNQAPSNLVLAKIGERHNSDRFNGSIDDVQIYSRALSAEEINATYNAQASQYYRNFTGLSDGSYSVKAYAQDYAGNLNETELRSVVVDGTAPNINFTSPTPDDGTSQSHDSVYINVTVEDALSANISAFIDWNNSLVGYWNFEDRNVLSNGTVYDDSSHCYDNETEILTDDGWKYFAELDKTEEVATLNQETMELEYQLPYEWQEYDYNDEMYNIILDNEQELLVSPEHKVYAGVKESPKSSIISLFENISTLDCCLNLGSLDQIGQFNFKASAKKGTSLSCMSCLASDLNSLNDSLGIILINASNLDNFSLNCSESICAYLRTSCLTSGFFNSSTANCGENKCKLIEGDLEIISLTGFGLKNETNMLVSTTKRISYQPSFLYLFHMPSLILLPISNAFASNSFSDSNFLSILSFQDSCFTLDSIDDLMNPDQFISGKYFILDLTSSGTDNVIDTILSPSLADYVKKRKNVKVFKGFGSEPDNFSLQPIKDVYSSFENGDEIWFMDAANEPVRVVGISKEEYNGKIYDVDVGNDVVLVRRLSDETRKNQRFFVSQKSLISVTAQKSHLLALLAFDLFPF